MTKLEILQSWYDRVWVGGDIAAIAGFFTDDGQAAGVMPGLDLRPGDFAELVPAVMRLIRSPRFTVLRHIEAEDWLWALLRVEGRAAQTDAPIDITAQNTMRFENGRIAEAYNHVDMVSFFEQTGALPTDSMALCLMGEKLR